ncbi:MAG: YIP1 family protein [Candidatus Aenigmatarchaeota archaeon]
MKRMGILKKIKKVLLSPTEFFENVKYEVGIVDAIKYLLVLLIIFYALEFFIVTPEFTFSIILFLISLTFSFGFVFFFVAIFHIGCLITGARGGYSNTFKAMVYSVTPYYLMGLCFIFGAYSDIIYTYISIPMLIFVIWSLILFIKGISILHGISTARAILSLIISIAILVGVLYFILAVSGIFFIFSLFSSFGRIPT